MADFSYPNGGAPLTRQGSLSLITPPSIMGYQDFFRQNSNREHGWMYIKVGRSTTWEKRWFVFDNGVLQHANSSKALSYEFVQIPMDTVITLRADKKSTVGVEPTIMITTTENKLYLKLANMEEMTKWLFCFQKAVALVLTHLLEAPSQHSSVPAAGGELMALDSHNTPVGVAARQGSSAANHIWLSELGHGHGGGTSTQNRRRNSNSFYDSVYGNDRRMSADRNAIQGSEQGQVSGRSVSTGGERAFGRDLRAFTAEDVLAFVDQDRRSTVDLTRLDTSSHSTSSGAVSSSLTSEDNSVWRDVEGGTTSLQQVIGIVNVETDIVGIADIPIESNTSIESENSSNPCGVAKSPYIPILFTNSNEPPPPVLAASYKEPVSESSKLENIVQQFSLVERPSEGEVADTNAGDGENDDEDEYMLFALDEKEEADGDAAAQLDIIARESFNGSRSSTTHGTNSNCSNSPSSQASGPSWSDGPFPTNPPTDRQVSNRISLVWQAGHCSKLGPRTANEDRFVSIPNIEEKADHPNSNTYDSTVVGGGTMEAKGYFAVYDGHCGDQAATYLQENLLENIVSHHEFQSNPELAVIETCIQTDRDFLDECASKRMYCGTTALGVFIIGTKLVVFNIGDCQAVLCSAGSAVEMSWPQKPGHDLESRRIKEANGWITEEKELYMGRLHRMANHLNDPLVLDKAHQVSWVTIHRVCGELAVSRSIGDPEYKGFVPGANVDAFFSWPDGHNQKFMADLVIPTPEIEVHNITREDEFILLASDGLWDVISTAEAVKIARQALGEDRSPSTCCEELCELALKLGSSDNVTIVLVQFVHNSLLFQQINKSFHS